LLLGIRISSFCILSFILRNKTLFPIICAFHSISSTFFKLRNFRFVTSCFCGMVSIWNCTFPLFKQWSCSQTTVMDPQLEFLYQYNSKKIDWWLCCTLNLRFVFWIGNKQTRVWVFIIETWLYKHLLCVIISFH
jgi:hypothetical protein